MLVRKMRETRWLARQGRESEAGETHGDADGRGRHHAPGHQDQGETRLVPLGVGCGRRLNTTAVMTRASAGRRQLLQAEVGREFVNRHQEHHAEQAPEGRAPTVVSTNR